MLKRPVKEKVHPSKKCFFWSNSYKFFFMITSLIEMLELLNCGYMTTSTIKFESYEKKFVGDVIDKGYDDITFMKKILLVTS